MPPQHSSHPAPSVGSRVLQTVPLAQQPFLAPPSSAHASSTTLQRSVSAPLTTSGPVYNRQNPPRLLNLPSASNATASHTPVTYVQHYAAVHDVRYVAESESQLPEGGAPGASLSRPASSNGMTVYIPPPPQAVQAWNNTAEQATPLAQPVPVYAQHGQAQQIEDGQVPPTPYFYLSVPESTPVAAQPTSIPLVHAAHYAAPESREQAPVSPAQQPLEEHVTTAAVEQPSSTAMTEPVSAQQQEEKGREQGKNKPFQSDKFTKLATEKSINALKQRKNPTSHSTKTYQEAAMQLLALKTASSSPPASPVKEVYLDEEEGDDDGDRNENVDMWRSTDGEGSLVGVEDSGFGPYGDDNSLVKKDPRHAKSGTAAPKDTLDGTPDDEEVQIDAGSDEEEEEQERRTLRFASIPPSSPAPRMSLSPESSPMPVVPSKLSATYLRAQASASRSTALGMKRKVTLKVDTEHSSDLEVDENANVEDEEDDEEGERISLDSSPEREDEEMKAPLAKRRLISMSSTSPRSRIRERNLTSTTTMSNSRSPSPSRYTSAGSSFATSVIMSTPHLGDESSSRRGTHSQAPDGLFYAGIGGGGGAVNNGINGKRGYSHHHRSSIFKIDNCSRPSAGLGMAASSSSPSRPFLLSSPEHAGLSKSLGLVPDNFAHSTSLSMSLPSDSEGFEINFLRGYNNDKENKDGGTSLNKGQKRGNNNGPLGLSEYAKDVFGGPLSEM